MRACVRDWLCSRTSVFSLTKQIFLCCLTLFLAVQGTTYFTAVLEYLTPAYFLDAGVKFAIYISGNVHCCGLLKANALACISTVCSQTVKQSVKLLRQPVCECVKEVVRSPDVGSGLCVSESKCWTYRM